MLNTVVHDWETWARSRSGARTRHHWGRTNPALAGWETTDLQRPQSSERTDAMQAALVRLGQKGDSAAVTTLLVQLRPGLGRVATWLASADARFSTFDGAANEVRSTFHEVVMSHDLDRRPSRIAANLVLDTRQRLWRSVSRCRRRPEVPVDTGLVEQLLAKPVDDTLDQLDLAASVARAIDGLGGTADSRRLTAELAFRAWFLDEPSAEVATELGLARSAARTRLSRLRQAVRAGTTAPTAA